MTLEEMLEMEAKIYVAMSEIDHELRNWYSWFYSPSRGVRRAMLGTATAWKIGFLRGEQDVQALEGSF